MGWVLVIVAIIALVWYFNYAQSTTGLFESNLSVYFQARQSGMTGGEAVDKMISTRYPNDYVRKKDEIEQLARSPEIMDLVARTNRRHWEFWIIAYVCAIFCKENGIPPTERSKEKYLRQLDETYETMKNRYEV